MDDNGREDGFKVHLEYERINDGDFEQIGMMTSWEFLDGKPPIVHLEGSFKTKPKVGRPTLGGGAKIKVDPEEGVEARVGVGGTAKVGGPAGKPGQIDIGAELGFGLKLPVRGDPVHQTKPNAEALFFFMLFIER